MRSRRIFFWQLPDSPRSMYSPGRKTHACATATPAGRERKTHPPRCCFAREAQSTKRPDASIGTSSESRGRRRYQQDQTEAPFSRADLRRWLLSGISAYTTAPIIPGRRAGLKREADWTKSGEGEKTRPPAYGRRARFWGGLARHGGADQPESTGWEGGQEPRLRWSAAQGLSKTLRCLVPAPRIAAFRSPVLFFSRVALLEGAASGC
ncbi:uncharacterized protein LOC112540708 [Python bivittatus]|uniref:Uncharacterized protein LOC112540708 n=1 Tax=Python bivittatus TaxID=176946 RepID=A0A9F5IY17_PYTBI|nr:uncharacterized protein LOC112540708 [Python bivittatus]